MNDNGKQKKRLGALDVLIIFLLLAVIGSAAYRWYSGRNSDAASGVQMDPYVITFKITDIRDSSAQSYLETGTNFYLQDTDQFFGTLREGKTIRDTEKFYEMPDGEIVKVATDLTGDFYRVDVEASVTAHGRMDSEGRFLLDGSRYIGANREITIYSKYLTVTAVVTGISLAQ
jgi:hypothetical protein